MADDEQDASPPVELHGADYRAVLRLSTADDETLAEPGETCERVPVASLPGLLQAGYIEPAPPPLPRRRAIDTLEGEP